MSVWMKRMDRAVIPIARWRGTLEPLGYFILGIALGAGKLFSSCSPFGVSVAAALGFGADGAVCLLGTMIGYLMTGDLFYAFRYAAVTAVVFFTAFTVRRLKLYETRWFMPLVASALLGVSGLPYLGRNAGSIPGLMRLFLDVVLGGGCAYLYGLALRPEPVTSEATESRRSISVAVLSACSLMGLSSVRIFGVLSVGRFLAMLAVMAAGFCGGPLTGCAAGAAMGLGMDLSSEAMLFHCAAYAAAGLASGSAYRCGRLVFCVSFCASNAVCVLLAWNEGAHIPALYECFAAAVAFLILPQSALAPVGSLLRVGRGRGETAFRLHQAARLKRLSDGFVKLYNPAAREEPSRHDKQGLSAVFDRAADIVCRACQEKEKCWKTDHAETVRALSSMTEEMSRKGMVDLSDLPEAFRERCINHVAFAGALNGELRGVLYRRQYAARLREGRAAAYGEFLDMAEVIKSAAAELCGPAGPDSQAEKRLIRFLRALELEASCSVFRDRHGRLHAAIEGPDADTLALEPDYLEKLSETLGARLCRVGQEEKGRLCLRQAEPLAVSVGIASMKKEGETVSGDRGTYFKTESGLLCVILSDGMGTGESAAAESEISLTILRDLLEAGVDPSCAMRLLNAAAMLRNGDEWGYATVDLCCIDLFTGETSFYKYGAAPSFVKTGRAIRRIRGTSLAAGMLAGADSSPDRIRVRLRPGNIALIASDGVLAERQDQWLRDILAASDGLETKTVALRTLRAAASRFGSLDDMTALAIRVEERQ